MAQLRLDLDILERNARRVADEIRSLQKLWRPHVKAHCQPKLAKLMLDLGAGGVTCATAKEVLRMAESGVPSILLAHIAVSAEDLNRLSTAAGLAELLVCADHFQQAELYSAAAVPHGVTFQVLVDVDIGMQRSGTRPRVDAVQLAAAIDKLPGLKLAGVMGYEGHLLTIADPAEKRERIFEAMNMLQASRDAFLERGLPCDVVSAGGSGSFWITGQHSAVTELQAGGAIFGDLFYQRCCGLQNVDVALTVVADVVSRPALDRAVLNCGRKAINPVICPPDVWQLPGATIEKMSAEHTVLHLQDEARDLKIGDRVTLAVGYSDHSLLMHRQMLICRDGEVEDTWPIVRD